MSVDLSTKILLLLFAASEVCHSYGVAGSWAGAIVMVLGEGGGVDEVWVGL